MHEWSTESSFAALATENANLILYLIIGHSKVISAELTLFVNWSETRLCKRDPDIIKNIIKYHIPQRLSLCILPSESK